MITCYECMSCGHETKTEEELEQHFDDKHSIHCKICDYRTRSQMSFERHMEFAHNKLPRYTCKLCNEDFIGNNAIDKHLQFAHGMNHWDLNLGLKEVNRTIKKFEDME